MYIDKFSLRIDEELLKKIKIVADFERRSINSEILVLLEKALCIDIYKDILNKFSANSNSD